MSHDKIGIINKMGDLPIMKINERMRATREDLDLLQEDVCKAMDVSRRQLIRWEAGASEMGIEKLKKMCLLYQVSADYLLGLPRGLDWPR